MLLFIMYCNKPAVVSILSSRALLHAIVTFWLIVAHPEFSFLAGEGRREVTYRTKPSGRQILWFSGSNHKYDRFCHRSTRAPNCLRYSNAVIADSGES